MVLLSLLALGLLAGGFPGSPGRGPVARAQDPPPRESGTPATGSRADDGEDQTRRDYHADCLASGCHSSLRETPWVHSPVAVGACDTCHVLVGPAEEHQFSDEPPETGTCLFCHQVPESDAGAHSAFTDGDCSICHDPHGGATSTLLRSQESTDLCGTCHPRELENSAADSSPATEDAKPEIPNRAPIADFPHPHDPFGKNLCLDCHNAHHSEHDHLLRGPERDLCLGCHEPVTEALAEAPFVHDPLLEECHGCHHPHGGDDARLLKERTYDLCIGCHEEVRDAVAVDGQHAHGALTEGDSCLSCHLGHSGSDAALLRTPMRNACLDCHDEALTRSDGTVISDIAAELEERPQHHGPFGDGTCLECHRPHASEHSALLDDAIPSGLYVEYSDDAYSFCFQCHDSRIITEERTQLSAFRDGDRNLHYVHVKREKSRTCGVCHEVHASHAPSLMKSSVPYGPGGWELPIEFRETPEGGTCLSGCHQEQGYDHREPAPIEGAHLLEGWDDPPASPDPEKKD